MSKLIVLVGCVKSKREGIWPAYQLYRGPLWQARWELAQALGPGQTFILSGHYGALPPNWEVESYDQQLVQPDEAWSNDVWRTLRLLGLGPDVTVLFLAGAAYRRHLAPWLREAGCRVIEGLAHVSGHGRQMAIMRQATEAARDGDRATALQLLV